MELDSTVQLCTCSVSDFGLDDVEAWIVLYAIDSALHGKGKFELEPVLGIGLLFTQQSSLNQVPSRYSMTKRS